MVSRHLGNGRRSSARVVAGAELHRLEAAALSTLSVDTTSLERDTLERVAITASLPPTLERCFDQGVREALRRHPGNYAVELEPGRLPAEVVVTIRAAHRKTPLRLFFPGATALTPHDVSRTIGNVIESMGPGFEPGA